MDSKTQRIHYSSTHDVVKFELRSAPCVAKTIAARAALVEILAACLDNQNLLYCAGELMEKMSVTHDGNCWILRTEAKTLKPQEI